MTGGLWQQRVRAGAATGLGSGVIVGLLAGGGEAGWFLIAIYVAFVGTVSGAIVGALLPILDRAWRVALLGAVLGMLAYGGFGGFFSPGDTDTVLVIGGLVGGGPG